jgi:hypothetical protein
VPAGVPQIDASLALGTQNPSGPRHPEPPLQPQPLQRQLSWAKAIVEVEADSSEH